MPCSPCPPSLKATYHCRRIPVSKCNGIFIASRSDFFSLPLLFLLITLGIKFFRSLLSKTSPEAFVAPSSYPRWREGAEKLRTSLQ